MDWNWQRDGLAKGLGCYERGEFFRAHEDWETVWLGLRDPEKSFLQALIKTAAALHHLRRGNRIGALSHLHKVQRRLDDCPAEFFGVAVDTLRRDVGLCIEEIERGVPDAAVRVPRICVADDPSLTKNH